MNDLRSLLRQHDPADGASLSAEERHRIRSAMFAAEPVSRIRFLRPIAATLMSLLVLLTITFGIVRRRDPQVPEVRRVEYTTPGGTRVIWTLDPSFRM